MARKKIRFDFDNPWAKKKSLIWMKSLQIILFFKKKKSKSEAKLL